MPDAKLTQRTILRILEDIRPRLMNVGTLWSEARLELDDLRYTAFKKSLDELELKSQVVVIEGEDRTKVKITAAGIARLAE